MTRLAPLILLLVTGLCRPAGATDTLLEIDLVGDFFRRSDPSAHGWLRIAPRVTQHLSPRVVLSVAPVLEVDTHGDIDRDELYGSGDRDPRRALLLFERLSLRFDLGRVKIEVGKQPLTWGRTDAIRPTDNLTPRDWTDPLREVRLSPWSVRANLERGRWECELALVPRYAPSRRPRLGGRWTPIEPVQVSNPLFPLGPLRLEADLVFAEPEYPATTLDNLQAGVRFGRRGQHIEWAWSYYRGFDDAAHLDLSFGDPDLAAATLPVVLSPRFPRLEVAGVDGLLLAGPWALRGEAGYFRFPNSDDDSFLLYEIDADWTRGAWQFVAGFANVSGVGQVGGIDVASVAVASSPVTVGTVSLDLGFLPAVFVHLGRSLVTEWELSLDATVGTEDADSYVRISGSWPLDDTFRLGAEIDVITGPSGSFFGVWRENDRVRVFARMSR